MRIYNRKTKKSYPIASEEEAAPLLNHPTLGHVWSILDGKSDFVPEELKNKDANRGQTLINNAIEGAKVLSGSTVPAKEEKPANEAKTTDKGKRIKTANPKPKKAVKKQ